MKYLYQFIIIIMCGFMGEILNYFIPLPVPASVYGMLILFGGLMFKIIRLENVEQTADFMLLIMPVFFISPSVSLVSSYETMKGQFVGFVLIAIVSTVAVMVITAWIAQKIIKIQEQGRRNNE